MNQNVWGRSLKSAFSPGPPGDPEARSHVYTSTPLVGFKRGPRTKPPALPAAWEASRKEGCGPGGTGPKSSAYPMASGDEGYGTQGLGARTFEDLFISKYL